MSFRSNTSKVTMMMLYVVASRIPVQLKLQTLMDNKRANGDQNDCRIFCLSPTHQPIFQLKLQPYFGPLHFSPFENLVRAVVCRRKCGASMLVLLGAVCNFRAHAWETSPSKKHPPWGSNPRPQG